MGCTGSAARRGAARGRILREGAPGQRTRESHRADARHRAIPQPPGPRWAAVTSIRSIAGGNATSLTCSTGGAGCAASHVAS